MIREEQFEEVSEDEITHKSGAAAGRKLQHSFMNAYKED